MTAVEVALLLMWLSSVAFCILSAYYLAAFYRRAETNAPAGIALPPMTILKPVRGADPDTYNNLKSFIMQDYPAYQVLFGVADPADPAAAIIRRLISEHPGLDLDISIAGEPIGPNLKVSNLHYLSKKSRHDIIVVADADMRVEKGYLKGVAAGFEDPSVGLVTCPYRGAYPESVGAALEALTINTEFLPSVAVAERFEGLSFALGATMALRREALDAVGGFEALAEYLADDYQLGNRVSKAGYGLVLSNYVVDSVGRKESVSWFFSHQLRWGRTYRVSRPGGYFMTVITRGTALSLIFLAATGFSRLGWAVVMMNLAVRYAQAVFTESLFVRGPGVLRWFWLLPLRDVAGFFVWFLSFTGDKVRWKDATFRIDRQGRMTRVR